MRLYSLLALALAFLVAGAGTAHADPVTIGTSILAIVGASSATAGTVIALGITVAAVVGEAALLALTVGVTYLSGALRSGSANAQPGNSGQLQATGIAPRSFMVGHGMTAGKLVYANTWGVDGGTPNAYFVEVIALSDLPIDSLESLFVNDVEVTYGSGSPDAAKGYAIPEYNKDSKDHLWVKFHDGSQVAADTYLTDKFSADPSYPYGSDRIGTGIAYVVITALVEPTLFTGFPSFKFVVNGARLYDPRLDTSVGGDGLHRFDDQSTWEFTENPKVIEYNILRGITYGGRWFYGLQGLSANRLPLSSWFAAMNECDLLVDNNTGGVEPQFRCGGEISVNVQPADAIEELDKCCNGRLAEIGGVYKTHVGAAGTPTFSFSDADLLSTEQQTFDQFPSLADLINAVTASFPDPEQGWELSAAPGRYSSDYEAADGDRQLVADVQYRMVPYAEQVQRLQTSGLKEARNFRKHTIPLPPVAWVLEPLDFISWTSARNGYSAKTFRVDLGTDLANLDVVLVITETDPADYDWVPADDYIPFVSGPLVIQRPASQPFSGWSVDGETITGDDGRERAAIRFNWGTTDVEDVDGVLYEVRLAADDSMALAGETDHFSAGTLVVSQNILSGTDYEARGKYRPAGRNRDTEWSSWLPVTTPDIRIAAIDIYDNAIELAKLSEAIQDDLARIVPTETAVEIIDRATAASDAAVRALQSDMERASQALLGIITKLPQIEQNYQRQLVAYITGITGTDVTAFSARLVDVESAIINLAAGKATVTDFQVLNSQINTPSTGLSALVSTLSQTVALLDPSSATATLGQTIVALRGVNIEMENLSTAVLGIMTGLKKLQDGQSATLAFVRNEFTAQVTDGVSANARAIGEVGALLYTNNLLVQGFVTTESAARVTADEANASLISTVSASLTTETSNRVSGDATNAANISTVSAAVTTEASARASADSALASSITSVAASVTTEAGARASAITTEATARASGDSTNAASILSVSSTLTNVGNAVDNVSANGYFSVATKAAPSGADARIAMQVSASSGATPTTASMFMDAMSDGTSRVVFLTNKFYISSGSDIAALSDAFLFTGGTLYVKNAVIANLTTGNIAPAAVTNFSQLSAWSGGGAWTVSATSFVNLFGVGQMVSLPYDASGNVLVNFSGSFTRQGGHSPTVELNLYRYRGGGGSDQLVARAYSGGSGVAANMPFSITFCDTAPYNQGGNSSYYLNAFSDDASCTVNNGVMWAMIAKR